MLLFYYLTRMDRPRPLFWRQLAIFTVCFVTAVAVQAQPSDPAPERQRGEGPYERLIIRGANVIDGTGAPASGPKDIVIEGNRIVEIQAVGYPKVPIEEEKRPKGATKEIDASGMYVLPGLVDIHVHSGGKHKVHNTEYTYKLWMGHGITTVRGVPFDDFKWSLSETKRANNNEITAPRMFNYQRPGAGWDDRPIHTPQDAREWVRWAAEQGIHGLKLGAEDPEIMNALIDEAHKHNLGTVAHLDQMGVVRMNTIQAARLGLDAQTHYYGLFESLYKDHDVQPYPYNHNYRNEQHRFGQVARQWDKIHKPGGEEWNNLIEELVALDFTMDPTMTAYLASRDVMRARNADWHDEYTLPQMWDFYKPSRTNHGSYYWDWTTQDEIEWKKFYDIWMQFLDDYKDAGGRVTVSSDAGFIYNLYGFSTIEEMELFQEAGFHPLEVLRSATLHPAEELYKQLDTPVEFGIIRPGKKADLLIIEENPIENLKVLYGTGHVRYNDETGKAERVGGVKYTIKDGIVYDAKQLLEDVRKMVDEQEKLLSEKDKY